MAAQKPPSRPQPAGTQGFEIASSENEAELRFDGVPFFIHAAQFDYFRVPPDLWQTSLTRYRDLGINTIDLRIPWNWHEPAEGEFDFDGHSNPRRNLRRLLKIITETGLKLVARPGPIAGDDWRNAGYPSWLLAGPPFQMSATEIDRGNAPDADLTARDSNAAAHSWLANETYMAHARRWMAEVAKELAPYSSKRLVSISVPGDKAGVEDNKQISGPLLFLVFDEAPAVRPGSDNSDLWRYMAELRKALSDGGLKAPAILNFPRAGSQGIAPFSAVSQAEAVTEFGFAGQWFIASPADQAASKLLPPGPASLQKSSLLTTGDTSSLALLVSSLGRQRVFPPYISGFAATTFAPSGDTRAVQPPLEDTLLASRILLASGARGITYSPLQDTLTPAGWETPAAARFFRWDAALDLAANPKPLARSVARNGQIVAAWGAMLASSHRQADFGVQPGPNLFVTQLVSNSASTVSDHPQSCPQGQLCAAALLAVANLSPDEPASESFEIADPRGTGGGDSAKNISLPVTIPPHDSLLLPIHAPLCSAAPPGEPCSDEVIAAGAELLGAEREGKALELTFYAPARATVRLHLGSSPTKVELNDDIRPDYSWRENSGELEVTLLRGAAPEYRRVLRVQLGYTPRVEEKAKPKKRARVDMEYKVLDAIRAPLGDGISIPTAPPLIPAEAISNGQIAISAWNHSEETRPVTIDLDGAFRGEASAKLYGGDLRSIHMRIQAAEDPAPGDKSAAASGSGNLARGNLTIRAGRETTTEAVLFLTANEAGNSHYQYDFDRDGAPEWALESSRLRLIVSPADGGRAFALVDKNTNDNLITLGGAFHDFAVPAETAPKEVTALGDFAFNRAYQAEWDEEKQDTSLRLSYAGEESSGSKLHVEKTLRLATAETVEAVYRVSQELPGQARANSTPSAQSFISMLSVPQADTEEGKTRICWQADSATESANDSHCEDLAAMGPPIEVPDQVRRMQIFSPGGSATSLEWSAGRVAVVPKVFAAQVMVTVPLPPPGEPSREFTLRYGVPEPKK